VKPPPFGYVRPESVAQAVAALGSLGPDAKVLAGGQSLVPLLNLRLASPEYLVDINRLAELSYVRVSDSHVTIGALARHADVLANQSVAAAQPMITRALEFVAHPVIRNRGTTVGSIVHADPAGEMPAVISLLGGSLRVAGTSGERLVAAEDLFAGPLESDVQPDELAIEASFPVLPPSAGCAFTEVSRRHGDYAVCGVGALVRLDAAGSVCLARAAYLSVAGTPLVLDLTDACGGTGFAEAARLAMSRVSPASDIHASASYRRHLVGVLTERALSEAAEQARERAEGERADGR
jgi:carbon-monoxide dehydrogenase medium subunit